MPLPKPLNRICDQSESCLLGYDSWEPESLLLSSLGHWDPEEVLFSLMPHQKVLTSSTQWGFIGLKMLSPKMPKWIPHVQILKDIQSERHTWTDNTLSGLVCGGLACNFPHFHSNKKKSLWLVQCCFPFSSPGSFGKGWTCLLCKLDFGFLSEFPCTGFKFQDMMPERSPPTALNTCRDRAMPRHFGPKPEITAWPLMGVMGPLLPFSPLGFCWFFWFTHPSIFFTLSGAALQLHCGSYLQLSL